MSASDPRSWMWLEACAVVERAERLRARFFEPGLYEGSSASWEPPIDIYETDREIRVVVALPGVAPEDLDVSLDAGTLIIAARRPLPATLRNAVIHRLEIPHGRFERRVRLSGAPVRMTDHVFANGCLLLSLAKDL